MKDFKVNNFDSVEDFVSYTEAHYLPLLDRLSKQNAFVSEDDRRLLSFLHDDLTAFVNSYNE